MFTPSSQDVRRFFCQTYAKMQANNVMTALETMAADWIAVHPEYHGDLADEESAIAKDYSVEAGNSNPFLHLSMHLSISEQVSIDQPVGIKSLSTQLAQKMDDPHLAAHAMMDSLGEMMWRAQRDRTEPDARTYLDSIRKKI